MQKRLIIAVIASLLLLFGTIFGLASRANNELERIVSEQFNAQQVILARKIAENIAGDFELLDAALLSFSRLQLNALDHNPQEQSSIHETYEFLKNWGVLGVGFFRDGPNTEADIYTSKGWTTLNDLSLALPLNSLSPSDPADNIHARLSRTQFLDDGPFQGHWVMTMALAFPRDSDHPEEIDGCLFILNAQAIARKSAEGVRSGKTGYAWVINHDAYFMYHVEDDFNGQDSLTIRHARNPGISYERVNSLVREKLLKGEEGTDWYISGWHWDVIREMKKLFAFSPIVFTRENGEPAHLWSVGLAAPDTEVYGLMRPVVVRQWLIIGLFFVVVTTAFAAFMFISLRWSETLRQEVDKKTDHLRRSEANLRLERDKVSQSMEQLLQTQEKLVLSERFAAIGEAAAHLSHEIKNPLLLMGGFAQQVRRTLSEDDPRVEKLGIIAGEAKRLEHLLVEVRDFTRPPRPSLTETTLNELVRQVVDLFQEQATTQGVTARLALDPELPACLVDPNQIKQVLINLTKNALEAMPDGGELFISTGQDADFVRIEIKDTGRGIPEEIMKKLFHPFFSTKAKGTGLGLAVSYKLVQDHGGEITVWSAPDQGARFTVRLPLSGPAQTPPDLTSPDHTPTYPDSPTSTSPSGEFA